MHASPPKLRSDLTVSRQQAAGAVRYVVKDGRAGKFFRFGELEQFIAEQLDGETPLDVVRQRTEARFEATLPPEALAAFVTKLQKGGLLEAQGGGGDAAEQTPSKAGRPGRLLGSLLYLRVPLFDPNRLFDRLVHRVRFCFTARFMVLSAVVIVVATGITILQWSDIRQDLSRLYRLSSIPLFLLVTLGLAFAHESAHGLTCKRFGGEVHELGFLLLYLTPAFYVNVSDAWLFPEKAKRLWVGVAGPYFELFLWALATLAWRLTDVDTRVNYAALIVMTTSGIKTFFNLNPFIKLDGYYLLSDYLELPNLRKRSFRYAGTLVKRLVGVGEQIAADLSPRERWIYLAYGLAGSVTSLSVLGYVVVTAGGYLIDTHQSWSLLAFAGLTGMKSRRKLRKLFGGAARPSDPEDDGDLGEDVVAADNGREPSPPPAQARPRWSPRAKWLALTLAAVAVAVFVRPQLRIGGPVTVLPEENADVRAQVDGIVEHILVDEGDSVQAGDVIARLSNTATVAELHKTEASIRETSAEVQKLVTGATPEEFALANTAVSRVESRLRQARNNLARLQTLFATAAVSRQEVEAAQDLVTTGEIDLADARARLELLRRRSRPEDIEGARARLASLEAQRQFLEGEVRQLTVVSPASGVVATPSRQLKEMRGQLVTQGALIAKVYDFSRVRAQLIVSEKEIADVRVGQPVALRVRAYPDVAFRGTVTAVATEVTPTTSSSSQSTSATTTPGSSTTSTSSASRTFVVTTQIDNRDLLLKPGMTGQGKVYAGQRRIIGLITRRLARTFKVEFWSWW
ncbi:MAG TPA: efflux RND transporter periplasmic adaptor subunit [Gemmatimonadales bacterium]